MKNKAIAGTLALFLLLSAVWADPSSAARMKIRILCSFLPVQIFAANVLGSRSNADLWVLIPGQSGPHDYQLTPGDMRKIAAADIFLAVGLGLESFLEGPIHQANPRIKVVETGRIKGLIRYNELERIRPSDAGSETGKSDDKAHPHVMKFNPHTWVSPLGAAEMVRNIGNALAELDPEGASHYRANADGYARRLMSLHQEIAREIQMFPDRKIVTFHDAFDYFARDHGLQVIAVLEEVAGQQPSAGEMQKIVVTIRQTGAAGVFAEPQFSPALTRAISLETGVPMGYLDPVATGEFSKDLYETVMKKNLEELKRVLGKK